MESRRNPNAIPPKFAQRLLLGFLREDIAEEVIGDLDEKFYSMQDRTTLFKAKLNYYYQVLHYLRPFAIRKSTSSQFNNYGMFYNYFKIAWRNLFKQKMYSSIKIGGFALGIAACMLITLFIRDEISYDTHYPNAARLYRMIIEYQKDNIKGIHFPAPFASVLKEDFPEIEQTSRFNGSGLLSNGSNQIRRADTEESSYEEGFIYADGQILDMLGVTMVYGDREHALDEPNTLVLSKQKADQYFPNENPIGKLMILNDEVDKPFRIGGVMENFPSNSHLQYDFLLSLKGRELWQGEQTNWRFNNYTTYILLRKGADGAALENKLPLITEKYLLPSWKKDGLVNADEIAKSIRYILQPVSDIHLKSYDISDGLPHGDIRFVYIFGAIAAFILIIACINFINLSTAKSANRAKEVGIRKVVGSLRSSLVKQFLTESTLFSFLSFIIAFLLAFFLLPSFNSLSAKTLVLPWKEWWMVPILAGAAIIVGILAGIYPSFYLSSFKPIDVLKGKVSGGSKSATLRSVLVIFQFTTSIILIVGTLVIYRQMGYMLNKKIGFDKEQVLLLHGANTLEDQVQSLKNELLRLQGVRYVSISDYLPIKGTKRNHQPFWKEGKSKEDPSVDGQLWQVDHDYLHTMGMKLAAGRNFSTQLASDSQAVIINQTMARRLGLKDPIGGRIENRQALNIIGVVEDFHFESMKDSIGPLVLALGKSPSILSVKVNTADMPALIQSVDKLWKDFAPNQPFRYIFLDESYAKMYEDVQRTGAVFSSFAILAIIVACLGLYGLSSFMVEQRGKEIGIRLVLGASVQNILSLLTLNFVRMVLISFAIAVPIAWYMMHKWLEDFVYRTEMNVDLFLLAGLMAIFIALLTISYQSIKAALMNPVKNLKSE